MSRTRSTGDANKNTGKCSKDLKRSLVLDNTVCNVVQGVEHSSVGHEADRMQTMETIKVIDDPGRLSSFVCRAQSRITSLFVREFNVAAPKLGTPIAEIE